MLLALAGCDRAMPPIEHARSLWRRLRPPSTAAAVAPAPKPAPAPEPPPSPQDDGIRRVDVILHGPLERALTDKVGRETAPALALVFQRLTLWWMDRDDERPGDRLQALYELPAGHEPEVVALRYTSEKLGKTFTAYRFKAPGAPFSRYYTRDGAEVEERLRDSPLADYDQVTSLLRDGRHHHGIDFKCPVGTPVRMPFDGTLVRKNWNWRGNGNCLEVVDAASGRHVKLLHLSVLPDSLKPGMRFSRGQTIAESGNTGHTTAPHLHYQLESADGAILDPFKIQPTVRAKLPASAMPEFEAVASRLDSHLASP